MVDSEHRYENPDARTSSELAELYWVWLDKAWGPLVQVRSDQDSVDIHVLTMSVIRLERQGSSGFAVAGGVLARPGGRFHFHTMADILIASLEGFRPRLPLWLYRLSHGPMHEWTMRRFGSHLAALEATP